MAATLAVEMRGIVKRFPGLVANDHVDFDLRRGEVHALLGENGAGKSTLMNILSGLYGADEGTIAVQGSPVPHPVTARRHRGRPGHDPSALHAGALAHGHRERPAGAPEPRFRLHLPHYARTDPRARGAVGSPASTRCAKVWDLSVGEQQRVEIIKMLYRGARVLIMDEPTAVLAPQEAEELFRTLRDMTGRGESIVFISHKLDEVLAIADRITILRRGQGHRRRHRRRLAGPRPELARLMVGRDVLEVIERTPSTPGPVVLELSGVSAVDERGLPALRDVNLEVRAGEIVGLAGVAGNGQSELAEVITGLRGCTGRVTVHGEELAGQPAAARHRCGRRAHPRGPHGHGQCARPVPRRQPDDEELSTGTHRARLDGEQHGRPGSRPRSSRRNTRSRRRPSTRRPGCSPAAISSGSSSRARSRRMPSIIVAAQPSRGLDVGAVETVHRLLLERRTAGAAVLLISEDLDEILALADRVAVIYDGHIAGVSWMLSTPTSTPWACS